ncbi:MAG: tetratricopeptide repeat protein [Campylobacterota bacterium]|nr:tetratricopeptide repeat protein [Campylobacterota bacterium]
MNIFQLLMLAASAFFAYKVYEHVQTLKDEPKSGDGSEDLKKKTPLTSIETMVSDANKAYERADYNRAIMMLNTAHSHDENNTEILNKLAFVQTKDNKIDMAIDNYVKSLEIDFNNDIVHNAIAQLYVKKGDNDKAIWHYEEALKIDSEYADTYYNYATLLEKMGEVSTASEYYVKAYELDSDLTNAKDALERLNGDKSGTKD